MPRLCDLFFKDGGGPLADEVKLFLDGEERTHLPHLLKEAARFLLVSSVERGIEAKHAMLKVPLGDGAGSCLLWVGLLVDYVCVISWLR